MSTTDVTNADIHRRLIFVSMPPGVEHRELWRKFADEAGLIFVSMPPGVEHFLDYTGLPRAWGCLIFVSMPPGVEHIAAASSAARGATADLRLDASGR